MISSFYPPIIAHRGASGYAPENTLAAFQKAQQMGIRWVEFDVMLTKCGEIVVIHDEKLERTTNGRGKVAEHTYQQLKELDAGSWFHPSFAAEKIITLAELVNFLSFSGLRANIELKAQRGHEELLVKKLTSILNEHWQEGMEPLLLSTFSLPMLRLLRKYNATAWLGMLMNRWNKNWSKICNELECMSVIVNYAILDAKRVEEIKATQRLVLAYTVNSEIIARKLYAIGVDAIFTDYPDKLLKII